MSKWKPEDDRPERGLWAPGKYVCKCRVCNEGFTGDKRALSCADCAYAAPAISPIQPERVPEALREVANLLEKADAIWERFPDHIRLNLLRASMGQNIPEVYRAEAARLEAELGKGISASKPKQRPISEMDMD